MAMGIKCSLFGHAFGETTVEREREEQGSEVVITIRELETCDRCGETRIVSENKEVTSVETPDDVALDAEADEVDGEEIESDEIEAEGGAEIVDAEDGAPLSGDTGMAQDSGPEAIDESVDAPSAQEDDGVILEDDTEQPERDPGEWPEEPGEAAGTAAPTDDQGIESDELAEAQSEETADAQSEATEVWSEPDPDLETEQPADSTEPVPTGNFRCNECGYTAEIESSSLREGDYCPQCHQGTLVREHE